MSIQSIVEQNNITVSLLKAQDFTSAVDASTRALKYQREFVAIHPHLAIVDKTVTNELDECLRSSQESDDTMTDNDTDKNAPFIYDQAILFPEALANQDSAAAILIFNAALANQLCAGKVPSRDHSTQLLIKAKGLYELAFKLHPTKHNTLFQFAIMNNVAVIERNLGNEAASKIYFDHLLSFWMCAATNQQHSSQLRCMRGFLWNVLGGKESTAPAA